MLSVYFWRDFYAWLGHKSMVNVKLQLTGRGEWD